MKRLGFALLTFLAIFGYCLIWFWQELDFTDEGFSLASTAGKPFIGVVVRDSLVQQSLYLISDA